jgi:hypothetical protein
MKTKPLTMKEKQKMADIYEEAGLKPANSKMFNKYRNAWHRQKVGR